MVSIPSSGNPAIRVVAGGAKAQPSATPVDALLELVRRARTADCVAALEFIAVNDSHLLAPYQQAGLWMKRGGVAALSGLVEIETNAPYVQWFNRVCSALASEKAKPISASDLPADLQSEWHEWLPEHALWIPFGFGRETFGGLLIARELAWREIEIRLFHEWMQTWFCAHRALSKPGFLGDVVSRLRSFPGRIVRKPLIASAALALVLLFPVRISVLCPGELVPANPAAVRAPFDGVIKSFFVRPNELVKAGQPLFSYDDVQLSSRLEVATDAWRTAEAEQRQYAQQALTDAKARAALSAAKGNVEEKRLELEFIKEQLTRSRVLAPRDGVVFVDDTSEWIGRSVNSGQRVLRLADPQDKEMEAWLPVADAIALPKEAPVRLYLNASPLSPASGKVEYVAYEASRRPDGHYAYRVRAKLDGVTDHRVGLKGTVRLTGGRVPLVYWALRRPLAALREFVGL